MVDENVAAFSSYREFNIIGKEWHLVKILKTYNGDRETLAAQDRIVAECYWTRKGIGWGWIRKWRGINGGNISQLGYRRRATAEPT